ncbi:hypothetical protein SAMN02910456_01227 [Ruminococcaceae bacterium YRB3002]|nr:hypothetical protein SAMN02910456_01227 [Ruminococcaceae bacterium YRB3002]
MSAGNKINAMDALLVIIAVSCICWNIFIFSPDLFHLVIQKELWFNCVASSMMWIVPIAISVYRYNVVFTDPVFDSWYGSYIVISYAFQLFRWYRNYEIYFYVMVLLVGMSIFLLCVYAFDRAITVIMVIVVYGSGIYILNILMNNDYNYLKGTAQSEIVVPHIIIVAAVTVSNVIAIVTTIKSKYAKTDKST